MNTNKRGYTLIELLVVLALFGILLSIATLAAAPDPQAKLQRDAERLQTLFGLAAEEAQLRARPMSWQADEKGYRFYLRDGEGWKLLDQDDSFKPRTWDSGALELDLQLPQAARNGLELSGQTRLEFPRDGLQGVFHLTLEHDQKRVELYGDGSGRYLLNAPQNNLQ
jgi:general secretion pathway protein H